MTHKHCPRCGDTRQIPVTRGDDGGYRIGPVEEDAVALVPCPDCTNAGRVSLAATEITWLDAEPTERCA